MNRIQLLGVLLVAMLALMLMPLAIGQEGNNAIEPISEEMVNPEAHISFPPPVYVVRDIVDVRGTVTLASMRNFLIEFRPLVLDMETAENQEESQWFPSSVPQLDPVVDDVLGDWNTLALRDGLYELRLRINTDAGTEEYFRVSPIRVENNPPPFVVVEPAIEAEPTAMPEPTATPDSTPRVIAVVNSNVRAGDSTLYPVVGNLLVDGTATIRGISSRGSGWYYIELAGGRSGFIHPTIVRTEGDLTNLPRINPPPVPATPIPVATAVPAVTSNANLVMDPPTIDPHPATCGEAYKITVTVKNTGTETTNSGGLIEVVDTREEGSIFVEKTQIAFGQLAAGQAQTVEGYITANLYYNERHHINLRLDVNNQVVESNENDNFSAAAPYILQKGNCG